MSRLPSGHDHRVIVRFLHLIRNTACVFRSKTTRPDTIVARMLVAANACANTSPIGAFFTCNVTRFIPLPLLRLRD